jgi:hypothetical protein
VLTNKAIIMVQMFEVFRLLAALLAGSLIGFAFGTVQERALRRNQQRQASGELKNEWGVMSGSMKRVVWLMLALILVQVVCPLLFRDGTQWWVSGGVVVGYGMILFRRLRFKKSGSL